MLWSCWHIQGKPKTNNETERKQGKGICVGSVCNAFFQLSTELWPGFSRRCLLFSYFPSKFLRQCFACQTGSAPQIGRVLNETCNSLSIFSTALAFPVIFLLFLLFSLSLFKMRIQFLCAWRKKKGGTYTGVKWNLLQCLLDTNFLLSLLCLDRIQEEEKGRQETREDAGLMESTWAMWERDISKHDQLTVSFIPRHFILKLFIA